MATSVSYASNDIQTSTIITSLVDHESWPDLKAAIYEIAHANKSVVPYTVFPQKPILLRGTIVAASISALDTALDTFRGYFTGKDKNLDIGYGGGTRRYICTATSVDIRRPDGLNHALFTVELVATDPFGRDTFTTNGSPNLINNTSFETDLTGYNAYVNGGSATNPTLTRDTTEMYHGVASLKHTGADPSSYTGVSSALSGLTVSQEYTLSVYVKGTNGNNFNLYAAVTGNPQVSVVLTGEWQRVELTFTASTATPTVYFRSTTDAAIFYIDAVQLQLGDSATGFSGDKHTSITTTPASVEVNLEGSAPVQEPVVTITFNSVSGGTNKTVTVSNDRNGQQVSITRTWATSEVLKLYTGSKIATVDDVEVDYTGVIPDFEVGVGDVTYSDDFDTSRNIDIDTPYFKGYL